MSSRQQQQQQQQNQRGGIDIRQALEILAARGGSGEKSNNTSTIGHRQHDCCNCQNSPFSAQAFHNNAIMGQVIDILGNNKDKDADDSANTNNTTAAATTMPDEQNQKEEMEKRRQQRQVEMQEQLQNMSLKELLQTVLQAQEERVATYRRYDDGLKRVILQTTNGNNMTQQYYPAVVAEATASFAVLSDTIRSIRQVLLQIVDKNNDTTTTASEKEEVAQLLSRLQMAEQNKLHLTAALHLEKIRISAATTSGESTNAATGKGEDEHQDDTSTTTNSKAAAADKINRLYRESIASLQTKIGTSVEEINEVLDEIRCIMME